MKFSRRELQQIDADHLDNNNGPVGGRRRLSRALFWGSLLLFVALLVACGGASAPDTAGDFQSGPTSVEFSDGDEIEEAPEEIAEEAMADEAAEEMALEEGEVEVEVESVIEVEVEVESEVEVEVEVEVVQGEPPQEAEAISEEPNVVEEVLAQPTEAAAADMDDEDGLSATGSEDGDGSPHTGSGRNKTGGSQDVAATIAWIEAADVDINDLTVRVIADNTDDLVIYKSLETDQFKEKIVLAQGLMFYSRIWVDAPEADSQEIFLDLPANRWQDILQELQQSDMVELAASYRCEDCQSGGSLERLVVITPTEVTDLKLDAGASIEPITTLLDLLRVTQFESRVRIRAVTRNIE